MLLIPGNMTWKCIGILCLTEIKHSHPQRSGSWETIPCLTPFCWLTDSVCSHSGMWNESSFQLLYLFFCFQCRSICLVSFLQNFDFWIALSMLMYKDWAYSSARGALLQDHNKALHSTLKSCWNSRDHAIFNMCTVKNWKDGLSEVSKARGCWNLDGRTHSFTSLLLKYKISLKSDRLEAKANSFVS